MSGDYPQTPLQHASALGNVHHDSLSQQLQNAAQPFPFQTQPPQIYDAPAPEEARAQSQLSTSNGDAQAKGIRLRKACDSCSIRKVKCDESGPPCRACAALDIPCTFQRPSRRRGPPNRHAEAIKKRRIGSPDGNTTPSSPTNVAATLASFSTHAVLSAESICPFSTLELFIDDFFTYIHPLIPFPHEPSFRAAFINREDLHNPPFLALLASMVGVLVASFPRKPRLRLKAQHREKLFPNSVSLIDRCHKVAVEARGPGYLDGELTVYDAATSYFLCLAMSYTLKWKQCRLYFAECLSICKIVGAHDVKDHTHDNGGFLPTLMGSDTGGLREPTNDPVDYIKQEIGRRVFWVVLVTARSLQQFGAPFSSLTISPSTPNDPYPPFPTEVDDKYIFIDHIEPQPQSDLSVIAGFNLNAKLFLTYTPLVISELAYGVDEVFDWNRQKRIIKESLHACKKATDGAPSELSLTPGSEPEDFPPSRQYYPPAPDHPGIRGLAGTPVAPQAPMIGDRKHIAYEIQKANIYATQLSTRSYLVEKYWNLQDALNAARITPASGAQSNPLVAPVGIDYMLPGMGINSNNQPTNSDALETEMINERENIVKDLLNVLSSISQINMEPNGGSFINKIRQIASTLLDTPRNRKGPLAIRAEEYLVRFLDVLMKLERLSPANVGPEDKWEDDEEELKHWADLRDFQAKFSKTGGFFGQY